MARIEERVEVAAGVTDVFRFCHDVDRRPEWDERVTRAKVLTPKPVRQGTVIRFDTHPEGGSIFSWEGEIVDYHFPSSSKLRLVDAAPSSPFSEGTETWRFSGSGGVTSLTLIWDYEPRGIVGRVLDVVTRRRAARRAIRTSLQNLKDTLEGQT